MRTLPSMTAKGPISTSAATSASGEMTAVAWMRADEAIGMALPGRGRLRGRQRLARHYWRGMYKQSARAGPEQKPARPSHLGGEGEPSVRGLCLPGWGALVSWVAAERTHQP